MWRLALSTLLLLLPATTYATDGVYPSWNSLYLDSYQFKAEITLKRNVADLQSSSTTGYVDEYFDKTEDIGRLVITQGVDKINIFYNREQKEVAAITETGYGGQVDCAVAPWDQKNDILNSILVWGWEDVYDKKMSGVVLGPSAIFHIIENEGNRVTFKNVTYVRGIKVNEYAGKINQFPDVTYTLHMTAENWVNPYTGKSGNQVPVRITANGLDKGNLVNYLVDITSFQPNVVMSTLEIPVGVGCFGLNSTMPVPELPSNFAFVTEVYNLTENKEVVESFISLHKVWFMGDSKYSMVRLFDKDKNGVKEIHDFNTGVMYNFDDKEQCKIQPLITSEFERNHNLVRMMVDPKDIFHLDSTTYYLGKAFTRGINCDVFETVVFDFAKSGDDVTIPKAVFTVYFTTYNWIDVVDGVQEDQIPVKILLTAYNKDLSLYYKLEYNIFNFAEQFTSETMKLFSIEKCFPQPTDRQYIEFKFPADGNSTQLIEKYDTQVKDQLLTSLIAATFISPLRIPYLRIDYEKTMVIARALVLERTPAMKSFQLMFDDLTAKSNEIKVPIRSPSAELCAQQCLNYTEDTCRSFHFCQGTCFLSPFTLTDPPEKWGDPLEEFSHCGFYRKAEFDESGLQPSLQDALQILEAKVKNGEISVNVLDYKTRDEITLTAFKVDRINPYTGLDKDIDKFRIIWPSKTLPAASEDETVLDGQTANTRFDCYRACHAEASISCLTFSFCEDSKECRLSSKNWTSSSLSTNTQCKFFTVSPLQLFDKIEGKVAASHGDAQATAATAEQCAQRCREKRNSLPCRGFEFCETLKSCVMHKKHYLDISLKDIVNNDARCDHYALRFSQDFVQTGRMYIKDSKSQVVEQVGLEECAKRCSEKQGDACKSFTYCGDPGDQISSANTCKLYTLSPFDKEVQTEDAPDNCQIYTRNDNAIFQDKQAQLQLRTSGFTPGGLTGLIFGTLFLGILLGAAAFLAYSYYRSRRGDDGMAVRFVKSDS